jgi:hypothetical protein
MTVTITDLDWRLRAACRNHPRLRYDAWFPEPGQTGARAKTICNTECPVRFQCLEWIMTAERGADDRHRYGIAGGLSPRERSQSEQCQLGRCVHLEHQGGGL